jgi:hypothetical protein
MNLHLSLRTKVCIWALIGLLGPGIAFAQDQDEDSDEPIVVYNDPNALVEVHVNQDVLAPYKERRDKHGLYFGVQYEPLVLKNYESTLQSGVKYSALFGDQAISLIRANMNYKYNFELGSIAIGADVGTGEVQSANSGTSTTLTVMKYGLNLQYTMDNIWPEPYAAPYFVINIWQWDLGEKNATVSYSGVTQLGYNYMIGVLIQLDWLDQDTAKESTFSTGLENTFIDLYITQYAKTESEDDPNTETDIGFGGGVRLEF